MYLEVMPNESKYWRLKFRYEGKEKRLALGVYPEVSLLEAREKRDKARKQLRDGLNPSEVKKENQRTEMAEAHNSFESIAREWHTMKSHGWDEKYSQNIIRRLEGDIFPKIGHRPIHLITAPELLAALRKIEERGALEMAQRCRQVSGEVFRYAIATGKAERNIAADLVGALKIPQKKNFNRMKEMELPEFLRALENYQGGLQTKLALKLLVLTFVRTSEVIGARWDEFNFEKMEWRIPAERMKMKQEHIVPLSRQVLAVLEELRNLTGNYKLLFPSETNGLKPMSNNTMLYAMYRMGYHKRATVHGFRATASTIINESGLFDPDVIEKQLAHSERKKVRAA